MIQHIDEYAGIVAPRVTGREARHTGSSTAYVPSDSSIGCRYTSTSVDAVAGTKMPRISAEGIIHRPHAHDYGQIDEIKDVAAEIKKQHIWAARTIDKLYGHVRVYV